MPKRRQRKYTWLEASDEAAVERLHRADPEGQAALLQGFEASRRVFTDLATKHGVPPDWLERLVTDLCALPTACTVDVRRGVIHVHIGDEKWLPVRDDLARLADGLREVEDMLGRATGNFDGWYLLREALTAVAGEDRLWELQFPVNQLRSIFERAAELDAADGKRAMPGWHREAGAKLREFWREHRPDEFHRGAPTQLFHQFAREVTARLWGWSPAHCKWVLRRLRSRSEGPQTSA